MAKTKRPKAKQACLPDMEPPSVPAIDQAAERYKDVRDERMGLAADEEQAHDHLLNLMQENGFKTYEFDGQVVSIEDRVRVRVRKKKEPAEDSD